MASYMNKSIPISLAVKVFNLLYYGYNILRLSVALRI